MKIRLAIAMSLLLPNLSYAGYKSVTCFSIDNMTAIMVGVNTQDQSKVVEIFRRTEAGGTEQVGFGGWTRENEIVRFESALNLTDGFNVQVERGDLKGVISLSYRGDIEISLNNPAWNYAGPAECSAKNN